MKEVGEHPFSADGITDQQGQKIKRFITPKASSHQSDLMGEGFKKSFRGGVLGQDDHFGEPGRNRGTIHRRGLNLYARVRYHTQRDLMRMCFVSLIKGLFSLSAASLRLARCTSYGKT